MKVKELIEILQSFNPESDIYINYDYYRLDVPDFHVVSSVEFHDYFVMQRPDCDFLPGSIIHDAY